MPFKKIGNILKPFGLEGRFVIRLDIVDTDFLRSLKNIYWGFGPEPEQVSEITYCDVRPRQIVIGLHGIHNRTDAENFITASLFVPENELIHDFESQNMLDNMLDCVVYDVEGNVLGEPLRIEPFPAQDMLILLRNGLEVMIPLAEDFITEINFSDKKVVLDLPEGLFDED